MSVLYITQNGIVDHIGRSQVAPYILGLAHRGFRIHVLSAEKPGNENLIERYDKLFSEVGIIWTKIPYRSAFKPFGQFITQLKMQQVAMRILRNEHIRLVHCRSFPPAVIGYRIKRKVGVPYIFDFRDFYADGGLEKTSGLVRLAYWRMKQLEKPMIRSADKVVCLTKRARETLITWYLADVKSPESHFQIIPCCADFEHFDPKKVTPNDLRQARVKTKLSEQDCVMLYLGSLGPDYLLPEMLVLFKQLLKVRPAAKLLFVSNNGLDLIEAECARQGIDKSRIAFVRADRDEVPGFISLADFSVLFYRPGLRSVGCSPTKLAELFAFNIPVIANTGVGDLDEIFDLNRNGSVVLKDFSEATMISAIREVLNIKEQRSVQIRNNSRDVDLAVGVERYAKVYAELLGKVTC